MKSPDRDAADELVAQQHRERIQTHLKWLRTFPQAAIGQQTAAAIEYHLSELATLRRRVGQMLKYGRHYSECATKSGYRCSCGWTDLRESVIAAPLPPGRNEPT